MKPTCGHEGCGLDKNNVVHTRWGLRNGGHQFQLAAQAEKEPYVPYVTELVKDNGPRIDTQVFPPPKAEKEVPTVPDSEAIRSRPGDSANPASGEDSLSGAGEYTNRHGERCSEACGQGRHDECTETLATCNCTYRGLHKTLHRYATIPIPKPFTDWFDQRAKAATPEAGAPESLTIIGRADNWLIASGQFTPFDRNAAYMVSGQQLIGLINGFVANLKLTPETGRGEHIQKLLKEFIADYAQVSGKAEKLCTPKYDHYVEGADDFAEMLGRKLATIGLSEGPVKYQNCRKPDAHGLIYGFCNHVECVPTASTGVSEPRKEDPGQEFKLKQGDPTAERTEIEELRKNNG
jgi:hypothetical protein